MAVFQPHSGKAKVWDTCGRISGSRMTALLHRIILCAGVQLVAGLFF